MQRPIALLLVVLSWRLPAACSSTSDGEAAAGKGRSVAVSLVGYSAQPFTLVSKSNTSAVELYSTERADASTKVQDDDVMQWLLEHLDELGYHSYARPGEAPRGGTAPAVRAIEVVDGGAATWWPLQASADERERTAFATALKDFLELYNITQSFQSVTNPAGGEFFDERKKGAGEG